MVIGIDTSRAFVRAKTGTENYSYHLIKHLLRLPTSRQHKFVLFIRQNSYIPDWAKRENVEIRVIKLRFLWTQIGLAWETWINSLDILWIPAHTLPVLRKPDLKTVVTIHGLEYQWLPEYKNALQKWYLPLSTFYAAKSATRLIAVSKFTKIQLEKELHTNSKKIKVIYEGVASGSVNRRFSMSEMQRTYKHFGIKDNKYVLFVGTIQPRKNLVALIEAFARIAEQIPGYKLVIAGSVGWMAEKVLLSPSRLGIQDRVVFTGRVDDLVLHALYQGASVYVQPSWTEGFGLPILEAMHAGVPVIASDGGAITEVVGQAGITIELGDNFETSLAKAIVRIINDKKLRNRLITRGYQRVKEFTWDRAAKETLLTLVGEGDSSN